MQIFLRIRAIALVVAALCGTATAQSRPGIEATISEAAQAVMQQHGIPGMAIAVTANGRQHFLGLGVASKAGGQPVSADTLFEVGSVSKTLTATLAAYAQARGTLSLSENPGRLLPALAGSSLDDVSLIHLATHTSGGFPLQLPGQIRSEGQLTDYFRGWSPPYPVGSRRTYANPSIGLLGRVAAQSLDMPYAQALERELLPALGMHDSHVVLPPAALPRYAQGYNRDGEPVRLNPALLADEAYGLITSSRDLLRLVEAHLGRIEGDDSISVALAATRTGYYRVGPMTQALVWEQYAYPAALDDLLAGNASRMALQSHPVEPITPAQPPQQDVWVNKTGSTNGFGAYVAFIPAKQAGIVILANRNYPNEDRVRLAWRILHALD